MFLCFFFILIYDCPVFGHHPMFISILQKCGMPHFCKIELPSKPKSDTLANLSFRAQRSRVEKSPTSTQPTTYDAAAKHVTSGPFHRKGLGEALTLRIGPKNLLFQSDCLIVSPPAESGQPTADSRMPPSPPQISSPPLVLRTTFPSRKRVAQ